MHDIAQYLDTVLRRNFDVAGDAIDPGATLDDLGVDSVAAIELIDILQEEFGISIGDEEVTIGSTVGHVVDTVRTKVGGA